MCDCGSSDRYSCHLGGCYCNRDEAAAEARAVGLLVRCGGGLPCACGLLSDDAAGGPQADPLGACLAGVDLNDPQAAGGSVAVDYVFATLGGALDPSLPEQPVDVKKSCCGGGGGGGGGGAGPATVPDVQLPELQVPGPLEAKIGLRSTLSVPAVVDEGRPAKRSRCQCHGEGGALCMCGDNCRCFTLDVVDAGKTMLELASQVKQESLLQALSGDAVGGGCCCPSAAPGPDASGADPRRLAVCSAADLPQTTPGNAENAPLPTAAAHEVTLQKRALEAAPAGSGSCCMVLPIADEVREALADAAAADEERGQKRASEASANGSSCSVLAGSSGTPDRPYVCPEPGCPATFVFKQNRDRHLIEVHQPERRPYTCTHDGCAGAFKNSSGLKQHESTVHQKNRPFKCDECNASFGQRNHLTQHTKAVHLGSRPFACTVCDARFSNRGNLNQHVRRRKHHPPEGDSN
jgi:hypothetical protein